MAKRRSNGEGNIRKRKDGRWEARVIEERGNGERKYRSLYGKSYTEVKAKKEEYYGERNQEAPPMARKLATVSGLSESWLMTVKSTVKEATYTRYYRIVHQYLMPGIGKYALSRLDSGLVNSFKDVLLSHGGRRGKGLSAKTVTDIFSVLKAVLLYAAEEGYPVMNVALVKSPRKAKKDIKVIPPESVNRLEEALLSSNDTVSLGILLTLHTGIRNGELCGLRWGDVNFANNTLHIRRTVERIADLDHSHKEKTKVIINEPKTEASRREIPLPLALCSYLRSRRKESGAYLLTGTDKPSEPHTLYVRYERFLRRNGFDSYTFHALRHTFATRGIEAGFDAKSLSEILGHSDVSTTMRCYVHPSVDQKRKQMETLFNPEIRGQKYGM